MLELLKKKNSDIPFFNVRDKEFLPFGRMISDTFVSEIISVSERISMPASGSFYIPSVPELEMLEESRHAEKELFGGLPIQIGICNGYNDTLDALEYHKSSEVNIAITPLALLLGHCCDIQDDRYDSGKLKAFYVEKGDVLEIYGTTLHFCPCQVSDDGFSSVVMLNQGVNVAFQTKAEDPVLFKAGKWLLAHEDNQSLVEKGVFPGLFGKNFKISY